MTTVLKISRTIKIYVTVLALTFAANVYADAGQVLFVLGQAQVVRVDGSSLSAVKGLAVENGDTIHTENNGQVQLKMSDGGLISIRPNSEFVIENYQYNRDVNTDQSIYKLIKGGFRSVTGKVGENKKSSYAVKTPVATIGIRGTDYTARYCEFDCADVGVSNGLYVNVLTGGVVLNNGFGTAEIGPTEFGFVGDTNTSPVLLDSVPAELLFASTGSNVNSNTAVQVASVDSSVVYSPSYINNIVDSTSSSAPVAPAVNYSKVAFAGSLGGNSTVGVSKNVDTEYVLDSTNHQLNSFSMIDASGAKTQYAIGTASNADVGYDNVSGVSWGRWTNGNVTITDASGNVTTSTLDGNNQMHWIATSPENIAMVLPTSGTATYAFGGNGTATTDGNNHLGGLHGTTTLTANFNTQTVDANINGYINRSDAVGSYDWNITANGMTISNGQFAGTGTLAVNSAYKYTDGAANVNGAFTNPVDANGIPQGALVSYSGSAQMQPTTLTIEDTTIQGVAYLQR